MSCLTAFAVSKIRFFLIILCFPLKFNPNLMHEARMNIMYRCKFSCQCWGGNRGNSRTLCPQARYGTAVGTLRCSSCSRSCLQNTENITVHYGGSKGPSPLPCRTTVLLLPQHDCTPPWLCRIVALSHNGPHQHDNTTVVPRCRMLGPDKTVTRPREHNTILV